MYVVASLGLALVSLEPILRLLGVEPGIFCVMSR